VTVASCSPIAFRVGTERSIPPAATLERVAKVMRPAGITRVANLTGLDRVGVPVFSVYRPNARSLSVSQGKGLTMEAARASGVMEAIELFHAENVDAPLRLASVREIRRLGPVVEVGGLPRTTRGRFHEDLPILWIQGMNLSGGEPIWVPYELVHTDFRLPAPTGSGAFMASSNGLASGNCLSEALSHALCELIERDAVTLYTMSSAAAQAERRVDPESVDDDLCRSILARFESAGIDVLLWETTADVAIASFLCTVVDRDPYIARPMPPLSGSGCHPRRAVALLRALTEAAQARLTVISGARDDLSPKFFDGDGALIAKEAERLRGLARSCGGGRRFVSAPDAQHETFEASVLWELERLDAAGFRQIAAVDLTRRQFGVPVVRVVVPRLEAMCEVRDYVLGSRAQSRLEQRLS